MEEWFEEDLVKYFTVESNLRHFSLQQPILYFSPDILPAAEEARKDWRSGWRRIWWKEGSLHWWQSHFSASSIRRHRWRPTNQLRLGLGLGLFSLD